MTPENTAPQQLRARIRKYFLVVFGLIGAGLVLLVLLGALVKTAGLDARVLGLIAPLLMLGVVGSSWYAVYKLWRCPKCETNVYWLVSWNMSIFATGSASNCPGCGVELYTVAQKKRSRNIFVMLIAVSIGIGLLGGIAAAVTSPKRPAPQRVAPPPPG